MQKFLQPLPMNQRRLRHLKSSLTRPILIKKKENLLYLTGHSFSQTDGWLFVDKKRAVFFGSGLEKIIGVDKVDKFSDLNKYIKPGSTVNVEYGFTFGEGEFLKKKISRIKIKPARSFVDEQRQIKDQSELNKIKKSMEIVELVFADVKEQFHKKMWTEQGLANFITERGLRLGAEEVSFPAIVASGANAAIPHHVPTDKQLKAGESIILDFGFKYQGYCSDFTRTIFLKFAPEKLAKAYNAVEEAYLASIAFVIEGHRQAAQVHDKSVQALKKHGFAKYFIHSLGHGTGLEIHELPNLSPHSKDVLKDGMVFSIEPGVYLPKVGGIRIEDLVYIKGGRARRFINVPTLLQNNIIQ